MSWRSPYYIYSSLTFSYSCCYNAGTLKNMAGDGEDQLVVIYGTLKEGFQEYLQQSDILYHQQSCLNIAQTLRLVSRIRGLTGGCRISPSSAGGRSSSYYYSAGGTTAPAE